MRRTRKLMNRVLKDIRNTRDTCIDCNASNGKIYDSDLCFKCSMGVQCRLYDPNHYCVICDELGVVSPHYLGEPRYLTLGCLDYA